MAKEIGITEPAIYRYFKSKNDILLSLLNGLNQFFADEIFKSEIILTGKIIEIMNTQEALFLELISQGQKNNEIRIYIEKKYIILMIMGALRLL